MHGPAQGVSSPAGDSQALHRPDSQLFMFLRGSLLSQRWRYVSAGTPLTRFF
jgi:hypothetical protein